MPVDILTHAQTLAAAQTAMRTGARCQHVALNVAKLVNARYDSELDRDVRSADIIGIDGMGIVWGLRLFGETSAARVSGIDLFEGLMTLCAREGFRPYLLGATQQVLDDAIARLKSQNPGLEIAGSHHGYFGPESEAALCREIAESGAHGLFVAMPTPRKERFMLRNRDRLAIPFAMGIGGSLDVIAGHVRRAPPAFQRAGLEWFYRLAQEPRRLAGRYLRTNAIFAGLMLREAAARLFGGRVGSAL